MKIQLLPISIMLLILSCVKTEEIGLFMGWATKVDTYSFDTTFAEIDKSNWRYIPSEQSGISDAIYVHCDSLKFNHFKIALFFGGNDGNLYASGRTAKKVRELGLDFYSIEYAGYGREAGKVTPSEQRCYQSAENALAYVTDTLGYKLEEILLLGFSLGTGVSIDLATKHSFGAVALFAVFADMDAMVESVSGGYDIPRKWAMEAKFDNIGKISKIAEPICLFSGSEDCLMQPQNIHQLYNAANEPKEKHILNDEDHPRLITDAFDKWSPLAIAFLKKHDK